MLLLGSNGDMARKQQRGDDSDCRDDGIFHGVFSMLSLVFRGSLRLADRAAVEAGSVAAGLETLAPFEGPELFEFETSMTAEGLARNNRIGTKRLTQKAR